MRVVMRLVAVVALAASWCGAARGDEPVPAEPLTPAPRSPAPSTTVEESGPEIFYLQDDSGRLVPVPGFRYRDFLELFRLREGLPAALEPPAAVLESLVVRCDLIRADAAAGTCPATVEVAVRQTRPGWARLPLELEGFVPSAAPRHEGPGRVVVDADPDGGYRGWFDAPNGAGDVRHTVVLEGVLPVELAESRDTIGLRLPTATATTVELKTAREAPEVAVLPPPPGRPAVSRAANGSTTVSIAGVSGPVRIRLAAAGAGDAAWTASPQAVVESVVRIDGRSAFTDATIRLENLEPGTDTIDLALPPRSVLRGVRPPATLVSRGGTADAPTAAVAIVRDRDGRAVVEVEAERPVDPSGAAAFEAIGFAVAGVESWRQWGRVSLVVEGDWRAEWTDRPGVRRVDPPPAVRRAGFVAAFAYDALPASLRIRVRPLVSRVVVEPDYRYDVAATRVTLAARLRVVARGAPATAVVLDVDPAFDIDDVGPAGIVDVAGVTIEAGRLTIPFLQPLSGDAVVEVRGIRWVDREVTALSWRLPVPRADVVAPANVVVAADSDIELLPDAAATAGLVRQAAGGRPPGETATALVYRLDGNRGTFAATRRFLDRRVDAFVDVRARLDEAAIEVTETIGLDVAHVPLEYVDFAVAADAAAERLEVRQDGAALDPFDIPPPDDGAAGGDVAAAPRLLRVVLDEPLLGSGELTVAYRLPMQAVPPETTVATDLALLLPVGTRVERQTVTIESAERFVVDVRGDGWRAEASGDEATRAWTAVRTIERVPLAIAARKRAAVEAVVEAAWLRTHVHADRREDTATYVVAGGGDGLSVTVPAGPETVSCTVTLDGQPLPATRDPAGGFTVALPRAAAGRRRVVEMRSTAALPAGWATVGTRLGLPGPVRLEPPQFAAGVAERRFFWEIVMRPDEHVLGAPAAWTSQQRWRFGRRGFEREPAVASAELAAWIREAAGSAALPLAEPPLVDGRAVYSGVGEPGTTTIWIVPTWCVVLVASSITLMLGLVLAYLPALRRPTVVVPCLAAVAVAAAALPDLAPLAAQAALPGMGLALLAWILRGWLDAGHRPGRVPAAPVSASSLTRAIPTPSLVVAGSSLGREGSVTAGGRSST